MPLPYPAPLHCHHRLSLGQRFLLHPPWGSGGLLGRTRAPSLSSCRFLFLFPARMGSSSENKEIIGRGRFMLPLIMPEYIPVLRRAALSTYFILATCFNIK